MKTFNVFPMLMGLGLVLSACDPANNDGNDGAIAPSESTDDGATTGVEVPDDPPPGATSNPEPGEPTTTGETEDSGSDTCSFICEEPPTTVFECDIFAQDCTDPEDKCMPWANDGGNAWNATRCSPLAENPGQPGDACTVEGSGVSGIDDCDLGAMCWDVDPETNMGTCQAMCSGDQSNPLCDDPSTECVIVNEGALALCLPTCDPLLQDCPDGQACYGIDDAFTCVPDASGELGLYGDACEFINACDPGLFCAGAEAVPSCAGSIGCCSEFCDLESADGNAQCSGAAGGQECVAWTEDPSPGFEPVGACVIPL